MSQSEGAGVRFRESVGAVALAGLAALALAGCGGPASSSTPSPTPSPSASPSPTIYTSVQACTLVTAADASSATGKTLSTLAGGGAAMAGACFYTSADGQTTVVVFAQT